MKGRDIVRGMQVKQFSQQFAQKWGTLAQTYFDKTGQFLNDGGINGGDSANPPDGVMDGRLPRRAWVVPDANGNQGIVNALNGVGVDACTLVKSKLLTRAGASRAGNPTRRHCAAGAGGRDDKGNIFQTIVDGEFAGAQIVSVDLTTVPLVFANGITMTRNIVVLYNVPQDVAKGLDTTIDGVLEGRNGSCVNLGFNRGANAAVGYAGAIRGGRYVRNDRSWTLKAWGAADTTNLQCTTVGIILDF